MGITWQWRDPSHIDAHHRDFALSIEEVLQRLEPLVKNQFGEVLARGPFGPDDRRAWFQGDFELETEVGLTGLRPVEVGKGGSFWAYRRGRSIPSHLVVGAKMETRWVCLWGYSVEDGFCIHTIYPGRVAPREIHDPELALAELPEAIAFWSRNAIVVAEGEYTVEPDA